MYFCHATLVYLDKYRLGFLFYKQVDKKACLWKEQCDLLGAAQKNPWTLPLF